MGRMGLVRGRPMVVGFATMSLAGLGLMMPSTAAPAPSGTDVTLTSGTTMQSEWTLTNSDGTVDGTPTGGPGTDTGADCPNTRLPGLGVNEGDYNVTGSSKGDAFDGGLLFFVNHQEVVAPANWDVQTDPTDGTLNRVLTAGPATFGGLSTTVEYRALPNQQVLRSMVYLANPGTSSVTVPVTVATNFGSDNSTVVISSSSGDATLSDADRWLVTADNTVSPGDAVNTSVLAGPGAVAAPPTATSNQVFDCADRDGVQATYSVTIPAGSTRALMFFNELSGTNEAATAAAARFNTNPAATDELLTGLSEAQRDMIVNWRLTEGQPDAVIRKGKRYIGNNTYNTTGRGQRVRVRAHRGEVHKFMIRVYNDGNVRTTLNARGLTSANKVRVRYFAGGTNVSAAMKSAQGVSFSLAPGEYKQFKVKMRITRTAHVGARKFAKIVATSASSGVLKTDTVKAVLIAGR